MNVKVDEVRTPQEGLLMFNVVEREGKQWAEVKSRCKTDYVELSVMIKRLISIQTAN